MKRTCQSIALLWALLLVSAGALAQNTFPATGNVGIGTTSPTSRLHLYNNQYSSGTPPFNTVVTSPGLSIYSDIYTSAPSWPINFNPQNPFEVLYTYHYGVNGPVYQTALSVDFNGGVYVGNYLSVANNLTMGPTHAFFTSAVTIGNVTSPAGYKLYVEQGILTEKVKVAVKSTANWSDYVFADSYRLPSLKEVERFIKTNRHLPDVPSAAEVVENGIDMAGMDATLLAKIEELTLYVIQQQKKIEELEQKINHTK